MDLRETVLRAHCEGNKPAELALQELLGELAAFKSYCGNKLLD
jgi:hypothetical protein